MLDFTSELTSSSFCAEMLCVSAVTARHLFSEMLINRRLVQTKGKALLQTSSIDNNPFHYSTTESEARRDHLKRSKGLKRGEGEQARRGEKEHTHLDAEMYGQHYLRAGTPRNLMQEAGERQV